MNALKAKEEIRTWILKKNPKLEATNLTSQSLLIEKKILSSLHIMDLILYLEKISGKKLDLNKLKAEVFKNIDSIYETFLA